MSVLVFIFVAISVLWLCYLAVVRPFVLDSVEDELRRMGSALDWKIINREAGVESESVQVLVRRLKSYRSVRQLGFSEAVFWVKNHPAEVKAHMARERDIFMAAPDWVRSMRQRMNVLGVKASLANSPTWWPAVAFALLCAVFSKKAEEWWKNTEVAASDFRCPA